MPCGERTQRIGAHGLFRSLFAIRYSPLILLLAGPASAQVQLATIAANPAL